MNKRIELRKARDFGEVIGDIFAFIGQNWKGLLKSYAVICGFFIVASFAIGVFNQLKMADLMNETISAPFSMARRSPFGYIFTWEYFAAIIFALLAYASISITTLSYIALYREKGNQTPTVEEVWSYVKFYFLRATGSSILLWIGLCIGFVLCLVPGFYLLPAFSLVIPIMVFENTTLGYAFGRAFQLVKDNYWSTLGIIVVCAIIVYIALMIFVMPLSILNASSLLLSTHKFNSTYLILTSLTQHICMAFYMMPEIAVAICYFSLTEQKDNTGLLDRINNLGTPDQLDQLDDQAPAEEY